MNKVKFHKFRFDQWLSERQPLISIEIAIPIEMSTTQDLNYFFHFFINLDNLHFDFLNSTEVR